MPRNLGRVLLLFRSFVLHRWHLLLLCWCCALRLQHRRTLCSLTSICRASTRNHVCLRFDAATLLLLALSSLHFGCICSFRRGGVQRWIHGLRGGGFRRRGLRGSKVHNCGLHGGWVHRCIHLSCCTLRRSSWSTLDILLDSQLLSFDILGRGSWRDFSFHGDRWRSGSPRPTRSSASPRTPGSRNCCRGRYRLACWLPES
mmetsp:Transcript_19675/g.46808  ORF Transcript_19675/g.46808 Transcript_19675/m.46808 type:complete len:201 (-) Transcript_19675:281-883(-)